MIRWYLWLVLVAQVPGARPLQPPDDLRAGLIKAQARWQARKPSSYEFTIEVKCFCVGIAKAPPSFRVVDGKPSPVGELAVQIPGLYESYNTVAKLFAVIDRSLVHGRDSKVQYDAGLGFPLVADLDPEPESVDDELYIRVTGFKTSVK